MYICFILADKAISNGHRSFFLNRPFPSSKIFSNLNIRNHFARLGDSELIDPNGGGGGGGGGGVLTFDDEEGEDNGVGVGTEKLMELIERKRENAAFEMGPAPLGHAVVPPPSCPIASDTTQPQARPLVIVARCGAGAFARIWAASGR